MFRINLEKYALIRVHVGNSSWGSLKKKLVLYKTSIKPTLAHAI